VNATSKSDGAGLNKAISRYYVVRAAGATANLYVDFHLTETAQTVNVFTLNNPARIVIDITPGGTPLATRPAVSSTAVVTSPLGGSQVGPNLFRVTGYGRPFETYGSWLIRDSNDNVVQQGNYRTTDWTATWGTFGFSAGYPPTLSGESGTLQVGDYVGDGTFQGASVPLEFR
jgi:hypothetical protein